MQLSARTELDIKKRKYAASLQRGREEFVNEANYNAAWRRKTVNHDRADQLCLALYNFNNFKKGTTVITDVAAMAIESFADGRLTATRKLRVTNLLTQLSDIINPDTKSTEDQYQPGSGITTAHQMDPGIEESEIIEELEAEVKRLKGAVQGLGATWNMTPQVQADLARLSQQPRSWKIMITYVETRNGAEPPD
jgi:hypothetical protein